MRLIIMLLCFLPMQCLAGDKIEIMFGGITYHPMASPDITKYYQNKISPDGSLISNFMTGVQIVSETKNSYDSFAFFVGQNSVAEPMGGFKLSTGAIMDDFYIGPFVGAYFQDNATYLKDGVHPFSIFKIYDNSVIPIVGMEVDYKIVLKRHKYIKLNNIISPGLTNSSLSYGMSF
jgi:hypothetical protein